MRPTRGPHSRAAHLANLKAMRRPSDTYRRADVERFLDKYALAILENRRRREDIGRATVEHVI